MKTISRFQEGITLNPKEYVLDNKGNVKKFKTYDKAKQFLLKHGIAEDSIDNGIYIEDEVPYENCDGVLNCKDCSIFLQLHE